MGHRLKLPALDAVVDVLEANDVVLAEIAAGLHLDQLEVDLAGVGQAGADSRSADRSNSFSCTRMTSSSRVTSAVPFTTIQCSARWKCFCKDRLAPGRTRMRLT